MSTEIDSPNVYEAFKNYPWDTDKVFQQGLQTILNNMSKTEPESQELELIEDLNLIKAKHFYFTRFQQKFDLKDYLEYEASRLEAKQDEIKKQKEQVFQKVEDYEYEKDEEYTKGLPNIIQGWLSQQAKGLWDKERLDWEFTKAKAFYYHARVEHIELNEYFVWKSKQLQANQPSCPFANLWQNKAKSGPVDQTNGANFVMIEKAHGSGATTLTLSSPHSQNLYTVGRLQELSEALQTNATSILLTATVFDSRNPFEASERIETKDTKILSRGLAYQETYELDPDGLQVLAHTYHGLARTFLQRLIVTFSNGQIPLDAVYLTLGPGQMRVVTEFGLLDLELRLSHAPIPPLLLLATVKSVQGMGLYLGLAASKLRGPELLRLGLVNVFVPEAKLSDAFETAKKLAVCPDTAAALQFALAIHHTYPGPNRLQVWEDHIKNTFGVAESFEDLQSRLRELDNAWSKAILDRWETLPPTLLRVIFRAIRETSTNTDPLAILELEERLNSKWRQTKDYQAWLSKSAIGEETDTVDFYFEPLSQTSGKDPLVYEAPQEVQDQPVVCPVTGQSSVVCPVTGQVGMGTGCPVTSQMKK